MIFRNPVGLAVGVWISGPSRLPSIVPDCRPRSGQVTQREQLQLPRQLNDVASGHVPEPLPGAATFPVPDDRCKLVSVLDDLKDAPTVKPRLNEWIISLTPEDRAAWEKAITDGVASDFLVTVVRNNGGSTTRASIDEWRAKRVRR